MAEMTLREVCLALGVSRRAVQGYENANLVSATNKTDIEHSHSMIVVIQEMIANL